MSSSIVFDLDGVNRDWACMRGTLSSVVLLSRRGVPDGAGASFGDRSGEPTNLPRGRKLLFGQVLLELLELSRKFGDSERSDKEESWTSLVISSLLSSAENANECEESGLNKSVWCFL